ncbi:hypothetical protein HPB47_011113 [Ixodes persulcatus]|uniref:Uncharacterized protein n=1 Tax=Ixodes persulcatus TaxID=34615 RepID=A0AC60NX81_IXOPE|nr:hypothetical protein HPB47_011113 [Ixodes persulcatus]
MKAFLPFVEAEGKELSPSALARDELNFGAIPIPRNSKAATGQSRKGRSQRRLTRKRGARGISHSATKDLGWMLSRGAHPFHESDTAEVFPSLPRPRGEKKDAEAGSIVESHTLGYAMASNRPISDFFQRKGTKRKVLENVAEPEPVKEKLSLDEECVLNASAGEQECESTFGDSDGDGPDDEFRIEELQTRPPDIKTEIPPDVARTAHDSPVQPVLQSFPVTKYGSDSRTFKSEWYTSFPWLEYSVTSNSAFCFSCRMFSTSNGQRSGSAVFVTEGYRNWKKALQKDGGLRLHSNSAAHKLCQASWASFKQMKEKGAENSVAVHLSEAYLKEVRENRHYISVIADVLRFSAIQGIAQRADDDYVKETLSTCGIHLENCIAQTYDGASVMSGKSKGVQALLKLEVPQALYVHCFNHRLNLVIVDACKAIDSARTFFSLIEMLYVFLGGSATHALFITVQKQVCGTTIELKGISETRWTCQVNACKAVLHALPAIIVTLTKIADHGRTRSAEARGILHQLNFTFVSHLCIFSEVLGELQILSDYLQNKKCDLTHASMMVNAVLERFRYLRTPEGFSSIWSQCLSVAETNGIRLVEERRINRLPVHLAKYLTDAQLPGEGASYSTENDCRVHVFLPILDRMCEELHRRFSDSDLILKGLNCFQPQHDRFMDISLVEPLAKHYSSDWDTLVAEMKLLPKVLQRYEKENECRTYLRNRMSDKRLTNLAVLAVEKTTAKSLELNDVVNAFDAAHHNRRIRKRRGVLLWSAPLMKPSSLSLALSSPGVVQIQELALEDGGWHDAPGLQRKVVGKWGLLNVFL